MPRTVAPPKKRVNPDHMVKGDMDPRVMNQLSNLMVSGLMDTLSTTSSGRSALARRLGYEYQGDRDIYTALGYTKDLRFEDYQGKYDRGDMARRIVKEPVQSTWRSVPEVNETLPEDLKVKGERTPFEVAWDKLSMDKSLKLWHNIRKVDLISGIGRWGVMFLGFNDAESREDFAEPVANGSKLLYVTPLNEPQAQVSTFVQDPTDPRFGDPEFYELQFQSLSTSATTRAVTPTGESGSTASIRVHWTRVIHVAEDADENGVVGTPRLQPVFNRLMDLDRVVGSSGEAFWRNAFPGMNFKLDPDHQFSDEQDLDELKTQIEKFTHRWERYIRTKGVTIEQMETAIAKPKESFEVIVATISSTTSIPQRILLGSERGELASSQDQTQYGMLTEERRKQYVEPVIMDEFIGRLVFVGALPAPRQGWAYAWPDVFTPSEKDRAEVSKNRTETLVKYADSFNAAGVVPLGIFLRSEKFMGFSEEEAEKIEEQAEQDAKDTLTAIGQENDDIDDLEDETEEEV